MATVYKFRDTFDTTLSTPVNFQNNLILLPLTFPSLDVEEVASPFKNNFQMMELLLIPHYHS